MFRYLQYLFLSLLCVQSVFAATAVTTNDSEKVHLVIFGDSWSDDGNICKATNDRVWGEYIVDFNPNYVVHNYAGCGAKTKDLKTEIDAFFKEPQVTSDDTVVYIVWISGNDYIELAESIQNTAMNAEDSLSFAFEITKSLAQLHIEAPKRIFKAVDRLLKDGPGKKKYVLVGNLPNFSIFPAGSPMQAFMKISTGSFDKIVGNVMDSLSVTHNIRVSHFVNDYEPNQKVRLLNFYRYFDDVTNDPKKHGIANLEFECDSKEKCDSELFHDAIHFNHRGHLLIAKYVDKRIKETLDGSEDLSDRKEHSVEEDVLHKEAQQIVEHVGEFYNEYVPQPVKKEVEKGIEKMQERFDDLREFIGIW